MSAAEQKRIAYTNGTILDGTKDMEPLEGMVLVTAGNTIEAIVPESEKSACAGCEVHDLEGGYLMPGLINMHVHLAGNGKPQKKQRDNEALVKKIMSNGLSRAIAYRMVRSFAQTELMSGVTTVRAVGGLSDFDSRCRDQIVAGDFLGPRILAANEAISVPGGHMAGSVAIAAVSIDEALAQVERAREQNVDLIKLMITGGVLDGKEKGEAGVLRMKPEMVKAVCDRAHELGFSVAAHVEGTEGLKVALENGVDSIEHGATPDEHIIDLFKQRGAALCTTLSPVLPFVMLDRSVSHASEVEQYNASLVFEGIAACSKAALAAGVPVALGNDVGCPWITQYDFWRELVYFCKFIGVSEAFALHSATLANAQVAGIGELTGSLEVGKRADMIVTAKNPLEDLSTLRTVKHVVCDGVFIARPHVKRNAVVDKELDKLL